MFNLKAKLLHIISKLSCITSQNLVRALCGHKSAQDFFQDRKLRLKLYLNNRHASRVHDSHSYVCLNTRERVNVLQIRRLNRNFCALHSPAVILELRLGLTSRVLFPAVRLVLHNRDR